jgi:hypothetical protein
LLISLSPKIAVRQSLKPSLLIYSASHEIALRIFGKAGLPGEQNCPFFRETGYLRQRMKGKELTKKVKRGR